MTREEAKSCIGTIEMLQRLAYNIHGVMDVIDADNCKKIIKALKQESRWIPVSERLPKANIYDEHGPVWKHEVLITGYLSFDDKKKTFVSLAFAEDVRNKCVSNTKVTAWMPLPLPYRGGEEC